MFAERREDVQGERMGERWARRGCGAQGSRRIVEIRILESQAE